MEKIILVSNTSWYLFNFRLSIIKLLQRAGYEVVCIANEDEYSERLVKEGATFIACKLANKGKNPFKDWAFYVFLKQQYQQIKPVFIFHYTVKPNIYGSLAAKAAKVPSIAIVSGAGYAFLKEGLLNKLVKALYTRAAKCSRELWFVNEEDQALFVGNNIVDEYQTKVLPGEGIDTARFLRDAPYNVDKSCFTFLLSARMLWDKGVGVYVEAARKVKQLYPQSRFQLLGFIDSANPSAISSMQMEAWQSEGVIEYLGVTDNVKQYLMKATCFVLPSYYREGVPRALLEAASLEIPIITTDNVGCKEVVDHQVNGLICKLKSVDDLADKMIRMLDADASVLTEMGRQGRIKVEQEFHERLVLAYYESAIAQYLMGNEKN
ncbi:glycosyltransferase family 4 protein [uncultured Chitinophaga sp.]|uniref:glycosyltransferase family 4 protein n=1 Tax=uncultured Chitinophaga sp. TaxID=339340 RepID=UPI0025F362F7|nr:glycosyltransferase family 4 protein [uncultured Chitinophaga sp.]